MKEENDDEEDDDEKNDEEGGCGGEGGRGREGSKRILPDKDLRRNVRSCQPPNLCGGGGRGEGRQGVAKHCLRSLAIWLERLDWQYARCQARALQCGR